MKPLSTRFFLGICALCFTAELRADTLFQGKGEDWAAEVARMQANIRNLVLTIQATDMHPYLLSELKNPRLTVMHMHILEDTLVVIDIEDGHAKEKVAFDFDQAHGWSIIRRSPGGDWKPKEQRRGDRLTLIPFPAGPAPSQPDAKKP